MLFHELLMKWNAYRLDKLITKMENASKLDANDWIPLRTKYKSNVYCNNNADKFTEPYTMFVMRVNKSINWFGFTSKQHYTIYAINNQNQV